MSLDDIWDELVIPPPSGDTGPLKRTRPSLFLSDSDSDHERPAKRATPAPPPPRPDVDALFDDLDKEEEDDLSYKPLAPALDLAKLSKEAEERHARAKQAAPSQTLAGSSNTGGAGGPGKDQGKGKPDNGEQKGRRVLPKLDEERLVGTEGFPLLIKDIKGFHPRGKGNEHTDLNRLLQVYQFWTHKMYPKTSFKDTVNRVEKLCHSKRMQVRLSVWRDEFKGVTNNKNVADDPDVIDLTEPTLVGAEDDRDPQDSQSKSDQASSRPPSLPPASSEADDDDDFDIEAVIRAEEERLSTLRATTAGSVGPSPSASATLAEKSLPTSGPDAHGMDLDEASLWDVIDDPATFDPPESNPPLSAPAGDDEMWDIVDQLEESAQSKPAIRTQIPISGVNLVPSLDSTQSGTTYRATNDDDWEEMYS